MADEDVIVSAGEEHGDDEAVKIDEKPVKKSLRDRILGLKHATTTRHGLVGHYDYKALCMPRLPCVPMTVEKVGLFFGLDDHLPLLVAILMGFQHALAMVGGVITVPRILGGAGEGHLNLEPDQAAYLVSSSLIICGLMSVIQIVRIRLVKGYYVGTGIISMSGTSFTFLPIAEAAIREMYQTGFCKTDEPCPDAYGRWLGTIMVGALLEVGLSFLRPSFLMKIFPPIVTGVTVFLIGASLIGVGLAYWAGGAGPCYTAPSIEFFAECPNMAANRHYPWGDAHWIGLGFFVFSIIIVVEIFGSPFMRNIQVMLGLGAGIILAAALGYLQQDLIDAAPWVTFVWVETFRLGFYAPALLPVLIGYAVSTIETVGDVTASCVASRLETVGPEFESRIQGGLLADGLNSIGAGLMTGNPTTTFSENNGVIAMTRTANRSAGLWACAWLVFFGVFGKIGGVFIAIPDAVLGGMTTFLFANVAVSGLKILADIQWNRRDRFIAAASLSIGLGVVIVPTAFTFFMPSSDNEAVQALIDGVIIILSTGYCIGALIASLLNAILPHEPDAPTATEALAAQEERRNPKVVDTQSSPLDADSGDAAVSEPTSDMI